MASAHQLQCLHWPWASVPTAISLRFRSDPALDWWLRQTLGRTQRPGGSTLKGESLTLKQRTMPMRQGGWREQRWGPRERPTSDTLPYPQVLVALASEELAKGWTQWWVSFHRPQLIAWLTTASTLTCLSLPVPSGTTSQRTGRDPTWWRRPRWAGELPGICHLRARKAPPTHQCYFSTSCSSLIVL